MSLMVEPFSAPSDGHHTLSPCTTPPRLVNSFHCFAVTLSRFTGRQYSPLPSITPWPVIATFTRFVPEMGDWHLRVFRPSNDVSMSLYKSGSGENSMIAPFCRCSSMLLCKTMGPVYHTPCGTTSLPPPFCDKASIALAKASVQSDDPSPFAPKSLRFTLLSGKVGAVTCSMLNGRFLYRWAYFALPVSAFAPMASSAAQTSVRIFFICLVWLY